MGASSSVGSRIRGGELAAESRLCLDFPIAFQVRAECGMPMAVSALEHAWEPGQPHSNLLQSPNS